MSGKDLTITIDRAAELPIYTQIADGLRVLLVNGELAAGERLPTVRQLATDLCVHHNTVANAYRSLAQEGWLELKRGRGATVLAAGERQPARRTGWLFARRIKEMVAKAITQGVATDLLAGELEALAHTLATRQSLPAEDSRASEGS
jgi:DNA-binding transcriptional regulator YhcF (GntR family)